ncbi:biotin/lipoyl-binding protein [Blautia schinkii]|nr:biotin/lipoyl-binding protein [Blautia schinkii]
MTEKSYEIYGKKALKALAGFLCLMVILTILSRAASGVLTPYVEVGFAGSGSLTYKVSATGTVEENQVRAVLTAPGVRVKSVFVKEGDQVQKGDALFELDMEDLKEKILLKRQELEKLDLGIADIRDRKELEQSDKSLEQQRAGEDYNRTAVSSDAQVQRAYEAMVNAQNRLNEFDTQADIQTDTQAGNVPGSSTPGDEMFTSGDLTDQELEDIFSSDEGGSSAEDSMKQSAEQRRALEEAYIQAKNTYEDMVRQREESLTAANRKIQDARKPQAQDSTEKTMELDRQVLVMELDKYLSQKKKKGIIKAPAAGVIRKVEVEAGYSTPDSSAVTMADLSAGSRLEAQITTEDSAYISLGDEITVKPSDGSKAIEGLTIDSIKKNSGDDNLIDIGVRITDGQLNLGASAVIEAEKKSTSYSTVLPLQALHVDEGQYYVLVVQEEKNILGTELTAQRFDVNIKEKNKEMAAIEAGTLSGGEQVILSSEKKVEAGDRVRLKEE